MIFNDMKLSIKLSLRLSLRIEDFVPLFRSPTALQPRGLLFSPARPDDAVGPRAPIPSRPMPPPPSSSLERLQKQQLSFFARARTSLGGSYCRDNQAPTPANRCLHQHSEQVPNIMAYLTDPTRTPCLTRGLSRHCRSPYYTDPSIPKPCIKPVAGETPVLAGHLSSPEKLSVAGNFTSTIATMPGDAIA